MKKPFIVIISIVVGVLIIAGMYFIFIAKDDVENNQPPTSSNNTNNSDTVDLGNDIVVSKEVLSEKNTADECWTVVDGKVYDITAYIPRHPGGDEVLLACGTDGTSLFNQRQTADGQDIGSGTPHSSSAANQLESYFIGDYDSN